MNADAFFTIGKSHLVCQDYAVAVGPGRVLVSDGCSGSAGWHTDVGSRLLVHAAIKHGVVDAAAHALPVLEPLGLTSRALQATLLEVRWDEQEQASNVVAVGDGVLFARRRDGGGATVISVEYPSGAPYYPSYGLDPRVVADYIARWGGEMVVRTFADGAEVARETIAPAERPTLVSFSFPADVFDVVGVASDGLQSFHRKGGGPSVPLLEVMSEVLALKQLGGEFVVRRMRRALRDFGLAGVEHHDDVAVAAIHHEVSP